MKRSLSGLCVAFVVLFATLPAAAQRHGHGRGHGPGYDPPPPAVAPVALSNPDVVLRQLDDLVERVAAVRAVVEVSLSGDARARALADLQAVRRAAQDVREAVRTAPPAMGVPGPVVVLEPPVPAEPPALIEIDDADFAEALEAITDQASSEGRLGVLEGLARDNWFSVDQVKRVIEALSFSSDRTAALALLAPRIVDPQNSFRIYDSFTFESEKEEARRILSRPR